MTQPPEQVRWESLPAVNRQAAVHWLAVIAGLTVASKNHPTTPTRAATATGSGGE